MQQGGKSVHYLAVKYTCIVQLVEFAGEVFFVLLKIAAVAGARVWEGLQEATWGFAQCHSSRRGTEERENKFCLDDKQHERQSG